VLRKALIQASWIAISKDPSLQIIYERVARTAGKKRAVVGIARRLVGRMRSCFNANTVYHTQEIEAVSFCATTGEILLVINN